MVEHHARKETHFQMQVKLLKPAQVYLKQAHQLS